MAPDNFLISLLFLVALSAFCWLNVFSSRLRRKFDRPAVTFWRLNKQDRDDWDAMMLAASLVGGMLFSLLTIVFAVWGFSRLATR